MINHIICLNMSLDSIKTYVKKLTKPNLIVIIFQIERMY